MLNLKNVYFVEIPIIRDNIKYCNIKYYNVLY